ncbi:protein kinase domain-containing protein [Ideonella alba]|uniref:HDOD domain-containing protein n=1 Tax=Ideonella alba TaxID=2824118 RepID=A0A941BDE0_9BURK|nr:HDOD domain-containing protein [Ideonella alba]MBQ0932910.1 HDOD domain-containing protein [Ideonella alba]
MKPSVGERIGRFELRGELGRGAQASVWRALDTTLQREVALKIFHPQAESELAAEWREEARLAAGLHHAGIVAVHDLLTIDDQAVLVSECVPGGTLAARLREGPLAPRSAVELMLGVLDALAHAHAQGVVHRDLKASNVLLDADGVPKVADFGIAARITDSHDGRIVGSPGTISPEAAAGAAPAASMDVFAAGMLLGEMLIGAPLRRSEGPTQAIAQARHVDVVWPPVDNEVDDHLRGIVLRATARDPARRWPDAAAMRDALNAWLHPAAVQGPGAHPTLDFLLRRMRLAGDFPALSDAVLRIQAITASDSESVHTLAAEILRDVALTQRLLRVVNSARFHHANQGEVSTVSRAVALVGFGGIRAMALSLLLLEHMGNQAQAGRMKGLFLETLLTAALVDQLTPPSREREEAFLAGMFSQLGRLLLAYYLPQEAQLLQGRDGPVDERAQVDVLGVSCASLGQGVAASWGLPQALCQAMSVPHGEPPRHRVTAPTEAMRWRVRAAHELVQRLLDERGEGADPQPAWAEHFGLPLGQSQEAMLQAVSAARAMLADLASSLGLDSGPRVRASRLLAPPTAPAEEFTATVAEAPVSAAVQQLLAAGIADVTATLASESGSVGQVLRMIAETLWRALSLDQVVLALRDPKGEQLCGRVWMGEGAPELAAALKIDLGEGPTPDLFQLACRKGLDTLIDDARADSLRPRLPMVLREAPPRSFVLLPMMLKGRCFGLLYGACQRRTLRLSEAELSLVRSLRNQAVLAVRTAA